MEFNKEAIVYKANCTSTVVYAWRWLPTISEWCSLTCFLASKILTKEGHSTMNVLMCKHWSPESRQRDTNIARNNLFLLDVPSRGPVNRASPVASVAQSVNKRTKNRDSETWSVIRSKKANYSRYENIRIHSLNPKISISRLDRRRSSYQTGVILLSSLNAHPASKNSTLSGHWEGMVFYLVLCPNLTTVSLITGACVTLQRTRQIAINRQAWRASKASVQIVIIQG